MVATITELKKKIEEGNVRGFFNALEYDFGKITDKICTVLILHAVAHQKTEIIKYMLIYDFSMDGYTTDNFIAKLTKRNSYETKMLKKILKLRYMCCLVDDK